MLGKLVCSANKHSPSKEFVHRYALLVSSSDMLLQWHALRKEAGDGQFMTYFLPLTAWSQMPPVSLSVLLCALRKSPRFLNMQMTIEIVDKWVTSLRFHEIKKNEEYFLCWFLIDFIFCRPASRVLHQSRDFLGNDVSLGSQCGSHLRLFIECVCMWSTKSSNYAGLLCCSKL